MDTKTAKQIFTTLILTAFLATLTDTAPAPINHAEVSFSLVNNTNFAPTTPVCI